MPAVITCPKCQTRLKLNKVPAEATRIQCPHCQHPFMVSSQAMTPRPNPAKGPPAMQRAPDPRSNPARPQPLPANSTAPGRKPAGRGPGTGAAIVATVLAVGMVGSAAYYFTRPAPDRVANTDHEHKNPGDRDGQSDKSKSKELTPEQKEKIRQDLLEMGQRHLSEKKYKEAMGNYQDVLKLFPDDPDAVAGLSSTKKGMNAQELAGLIEQGKNALEKKELMAAEGFYLKAKQLVPDDEEVANGLLAVREAIRQDRLEKAKLNISQMKYQEALVDYKEVLRIFPDDPDAIFGVRIAKKSLDERQRQQEDQDTQKLAREKEEKRKTDLAALIKQGKDALDLKQFPAAEGFFLKARDLAPGDDDATKGLLAVREAMAQDELQRRFSNLLDSAKGNLQAGKYADAIREATAAQQVAPGNAVWFGDALAVQQAAEQQLAMLKNQDQRNQAFANIMNDGAAALRERRFPEAVESFKAALKVVPGDPTATRGLADAETGKQQMMAELAIIQNQYQALMAYGNQALNAGLFADAVNSFREASRLMPNDPAARGALLDAEGKLNRITTYRTAMETGRNAMVQRQYAAAMLAYNDAMLSFPGDPFAQQGFKDAQQLLLGLMQTKQIVDLKLIQANLRLNNKEYVAARTLYIDAANMMPDHPDIFATNNLARFADFMAQGTDAAATNRFGDAVNRFLDALQTIPNNLLAQAALQDAWNAGLAMYPDAMNRGKMALDAKNYPDAVAGYADAVRALPDNILLDNDPRFPLLKPSRDAALQGLADAQRLGKQRYDDDMTKGKIAMDARNFTEAIALYTDALRILPGDPPAQQGLNDAQRLLQTGRDFDAKIQQANQYLKANRFADARDLFNSLVPLAATPTQAQAMKDQAAYADAMDRGQTASTLKRFPDAVLAYSDALRIVAADPAATKGLQDAQKQLSGADLAKVFDARVKAAEDLLSLQKYAEASKAFADAVAASPSDPSVATLKFKGKFADAMNKGQTAMGMKNYAGALVSFTDALTQLPGNALALQGQRDAQKMIDGASAARDFESRLAQAEKLLAGRKFDQAGKMFTDVSNLLPADPRAAAAGQKGRYALAMARGQLAMSAKTYADAVAAYNDALKEMAGDPNATQGLQDAQRQLQAAGLAQDFDAKVKQGDQSLAVKQYADASKSFNDALKSQPGNPQAGVVQNKVRYADAMIRGQTTLAAKDFTGAVAAYADALKAMPRDPAAMAGQQEAQKQLQAIGVARDFDAKTRLAEQMLSAKRYGEAGKAFTDAANLIPGDPRAQALQNKAAFAQSMVLAQSAMKAGKFGEAAGFFKSALSQLNDPDAQQGLQDAQRFAKSAQDVAAKLSLANTNLQQRKYFEASKAFSDAIALLPPNDPQVAGLGAKVRYADAMANAGTSMDSKKYQTAVTYYNAALQAQKLDPAATQGLQEAQRQVQGEQGRRDFDARLNQGNQNLTLSKYTEASKSFHDALKLLPPGDPQTATVQKLANYADSMAQGKTALSAGNYAGAISNFTAATRNAPPNDNTAQAALADAQQRQAQAQATALQNRKDFDAKVNQANGLINTQHYAEAASLLGDALRLIADPQVQRTHDYADAMAKGNIAMSRKMHKEAQHQFQIALTIRPGDPAAMTALNNAKKAK